MARLLVVDEDAKTLHILTTLLQTEGFKVVPVVGLDKSMPFIKSQHFDLAIMDISRDPETGLRLLISVRQERPDLPLFVIRDGKCPEPGPDVAALRNLKWVVKPVKLREFIADVQKTVDFGGIQGSEPEKVCKLVVEEFSGAGNLVGVSPAMMSVCSMVKRIGPTDITILIHGERGLEAETVARAIHESSLCCAGNFVRLDCGAVADEAKALLALFGSAHASAGAGAQKGVFEESNGGTLFLECVEALPVTVQPKINDVLLKKKFSRGGGGEISIKVRVIASTCDNIEKRAQSGAFDAGLFKTLSLMSIHIKPLRERKDDIVPLVEQFLQGIPDRQPVSCDSETLSILERYPWPGNTRELREAVRHAVEHSSGPVITKAALPSAIAAVGMARGKV